MKLTLSLVAPPVSLYQLLTNGAEATFLKRTWIPDLCKSCEWVQGLTRNLNLGITSQGPSEDPGKLPGPGDHTDH